MTTAAVVDMPPSRVEVLVVGILMIAGVLMSASLRPYDSATPPMAMSLTLISALVGSALFWAGLRRLAVPRGRSAAGAVWAPLPWNTLLLSQLPYIGFLLLPVEIVVSALIVRSRARLAGAWTALLLASIVRLTTLAVIYAAAPLFRGLFPFPWR